jgi:hypothetical protein
MRLVEAVVILLMILAGCNDIGSPVTSPRIHPGIGIDGAIVGQSRETTRKVLGNPTGGGIWDGARSAGIVETWDTGPHAGLSVFYNNSFVNNVEQTGPADFISAGETFVGTTAEGIGVHSRIDNILRAYPLPSYRSLDSTGGGTLAYCLAGKYCIFSLKDSVAIRVGIGFNDPPKPGDFPFYCP